MSENTFPIYKVDAIVLFFRNEVLTAQEAKHFTKADLLPSPKPEMVQRLYMRILQVLYRFRPECHNMVPLMENIQNPAYHEVTTSIMRIYLLMRQVVGMCFVKEFSLNDLLAPKAKKTMSILSGIMNFIYFRKMRMQISQEHVARFRVDMDRLQTCTRGIKEAEKKIEILTTIPPEMQAEDRELSAALSALQATSTQEYQEANVLNETVAEWKTKIAEQTQKVAHTKVEVSTLKEEIIRLRSGVLESPEDLKNLMEKMRENLRVIKTSIKVADVRLVELQNTVQGLDQSGGEIQTMYGLLQDLQSAMGVSKQLNEELQELLAQNEKLKKQLKNLSTEEVQMKRAEGMKMDKASKLYIRRQKHKESKDLHVQDVLGQCDQVQQKREEKAEQIQEITRDTIRLRAKMQSLRDVCGQTTAKAQGLFDMILASLDNLHKGIEKRSAEVNVELENVAAVF
ncbi:kinetochore protein Nuf2 [Gadus macrocephalus]|uniref:kinetochore protein Nuf2 n=1 Tax=Gadus macrocephalus TaxID=80720 RepID=UPI0028CB76CE|nr:kinetochore protein Nuf2 [Gadus macrocephalus]